MLKQTIILFTQNKGKAGDVALKLLGISNRDNPLKISEIPKYKSLT